MTCYLRLHEVAIAVHPTPAQGEGAETDWDEIGRLWTLAGGVDGRDAALDAMPVTLVDMDDLPDADLEGFAGLVIAGRADQLLLAGMKQRIAALLGRGGAVVFSGQLAEDWLPEATTFEWHQDKADTTGPPRLADHPVFSGVDPEELGHSFLYANGWHRPPAGAEVIAWRGDGTPGAYVARAGAGTVLVHSGNNLIANGVTTTTAARIMPQLVQWIAGTSR
ncbi:hypothetical protein MCHIJ_09430 [Mycolicibacterium chitae]|uniref:Uncharacterized protein n=1 Tax=Mycolicibacterium chitae TaxID=1792 RepID=A0A448ICY4_MYCCI|nr:hypothetical protein [Mycolicibacterium chitae]MCV7109142.1 hypothetical protein [Mycolicibacterium chitae]BBZ01506.1 hypothetical protein MCHIJ_09430 [Mycolicibacterium chitae]VEG50342.1 Uncharacterised protein [Mycolicibacterium chitae]